MEKILSLQGIHKRFSGVHALKGCDFDLKAGEVHALVGENGAGKSTLMKVLTGIHQPDEGKIIYMGKEVSFTGPRDAQDMGISIVHQELNLINNLTVAQNIFIGREGKSLFTNDKYINDKAGEILKQLNIDINPTDIMGDLTVGQGQLVEIVKAVSFDANIIIFDEPTASLSEEETKTLFKIINDLRDKGVGMVYISHRMGEIKEISDRVTVMRDGEYVDTKNTSDITVDEIISMMVGRTIYEEPKSHSMVPPNAPVVLKVENLVSKDVKGVSFDLHKGEILGFAGLVGAGRTETARLIFGADPIISGKIFINDKETEIKSPQDAVKVGIGYLSEDRKQFGLCLGLSIADNSVLSSLDDFIKGGFIFDKSIEKVSNEYVEKINIKTPTIKQLAKNLSGGNQQKVVLAKWLIKNSDILIFDEPTRGIDVGAKSEIYKLMTNLAESGKSIIMISSEMQELLRMSDRILVMCEGKQTGIINIEDANQEYIMKLATKHG
ncbi:MAG: sugar ABC transporter ATP-binding protein [Abditibacteriota bacterium]|nr:sugar ABC transporter ATP-binding protein [Abditibacteriota bacterium]